MPAIGSSASVPMHVERRRRRRRTPTTGTASPDTYLQNTGSSAARYSRGAAAPRIPQYARTNTERTTPSVAALRPRRSIPLRNGVPQPEGPDRRRPRRRVRRVIDRVADIASQEVPGAEQTARRIARAAIRASRQTGVPASLLIGLTGQESAYGTNTGPSSAGARSETQFIESTRNYMIEKYGVDPWAGTQDSLLAAALYLKELGVLDNPSQALSRYSGGYAESEYNNPILQRAQRFAETGIDRLARSRLRIPAVPDGPLPGPYAGSRRVIRELLGPYARTEDWQDKEDRGGTGESLHDFGRPNAYAADLSPREEIVDQIVRRLARFNPGLDPDEINYGTTGLESGLTYKGYDIEFLPYTHGSGPHIHIGAEWTGEALPPGTVSGPLGGAGAAAAALDELVGGGSQLPAPAAQRPRPRRGGGFSQRNELAARPVLPLVGEAGEGEDLLNQLEGGDVATFRPQRRRPRRR